MFGSGGWINAEGQYTSVSGGGSSGFSNDDNFYAGASLETAFPMTPQAGQYFYSHPVTTAAIVGGGAVCGGALIACHASGICEAVEAGAAGAGALDLGATAIEESPSTIGELLSGSHPDTMVHITPFEEADFAGGIDKGTYFARLGDVSDMTISEFRTDVVGPAAAGYGTNANMFVLVGPEAASAFESAGTGNLSGTMEYVSTRPLAASQCVRVPGF
jgi:hypothetical protein